MKKTDVSRICKICFSLAGAVLLFFILQGCYRGIGRQLFYRLEYHSFQLVDPEGRPIDGRKMAPISCFKYRSSVNLLPGESVYHVEPIRFDEKGRAGRFGWVRNRVSLNHLYIPELYYPYSGDFIPETDGSVITLLPVRNPVPLFFGKLHLRLDDNYSGKLQFRFSDLELSIPYTHEYRLVYRWNEQEKAGEWHKTSNEKYRPDLVFDILSGTASGNYTGGETGYNIHLQGRGAAQKNSRPKRSLSAELASGAQVKFQRHHSVFPGPYEAPPPERYGRFRIGDGYDVQRGFMDPVVFSFPFRGKICCGAVRRMMSMGENRIEFEFLLNLAGDRNLEPGKHIPKHGQSELWEKEQTIRPASALKEFRDKDSKPRPKIRELWVLESEKIRYTVWGYISNGQRRIAHIRYDQKNGAGYIYINGAITTGCKPELLDVNFDGYPDLLLHDGCRNGRHRYKFYIASDTGGSMILNPLFTEKLQGDLSLDPPKRLIHVSRQDADGKTIRKTYQVSSDPHISIIAPKYLTEYSHAAEKKP